MSKIFKTKHVFLVAVICIFSLYHVSAQNEKSEKSGSKKEFFCFGPKIAVNFTNFSNAINADFLPGADLGLFFRFNIARFYIQPEVNYVIRNLNITTGESGTILHFEKTQTHFINVPIFVGYRIVDFRLFKLRIFAGPEFNFSVNNSVMYGEYQLGFQGGLGVDLWRFTVDAGYSFLADVQKGGKGIHNNIFKVGVGFKCF
jgi:hypothetical protein